MKSTLSIIFMLFLFLSCSNKRWTEKAKLELVSECEKSSQYIESESPSEICSCIIDKFTQDFSFEEYLKMTQEAITSQSNHEIYNKIDIYIGSTLEK